MAFALGRDKIALGQEKHKLGRPQNDRGRGKIALAQETIALGQGENDPWSLEYGKGRVENGSGAGFY